MTGVVAQYLGLKDLYKGVFRQADNILDFLG
jgi:hypothetical protein